MSFKNKFLSAITFAFAILAFSTFASAQDTQKTDSDNTQKQERREWRKRDGKRDGFGGREFRRGGRGGGFMFGFRELNLSDAQKEQIKNIMESNRQKQENFDEIRSLHEAKRNGTLTAEQKERLQTLRQDRQAKQESIRQQVLAVLTPEQRQQLEAKKAEMQKRWEERKQQRRENRQTPETEKKDN